jgi:hypothetical protein
MRLRMLSGMPRGYGYAAKSSTTLTVTFGEKKGSQAEEKGASEVEVSEAPSRSSPSLASLFVFVSSV